MIFMLFVFSMIVSGSGIYILNVNPEKSLLGWGLLITGVIFFLLTMILYIKKDKNRGSDYCCDWAVHIPDCGILPDCDGKPDCDCTPDCTP